MLSSGPDPEAAVRAGRARVELTRRRELTPEERRICDRIKGRWRLAEQQRQRKRMGVVA